VICRADGNELFTQLIEWSEKQTFSRVIDLDLTTGDHVVSFEIVPLTPVATPAKPARRPDPAEPEPPVVAVAGEKPQDGNAAKASIAAVVAAVAAGTADAAKAAETPPVAGAAALVGARRPPTPVTRLDVAIVSVKLGGPRARNFG
jgi:hypothetical protein